MGQINKGTIAGISGNTARVVPSGSKPVVNATIPENLLGDGGNLKKGTEVVFVEFDDFTGLLLCRADGESAGGTVELDTTLTQEGMAADAKAVGLRLEEISATYPLAEGAAELHPDKYYVFGEVSELSLTLIEVNDGKAHEYCFEFVPTSSFSGLHISPEVSWASPCIFTAGDVHQVSILRGVGVLIRA